MCRLAVDSCRRLVEWRLAVLRRCAEVVVATAACILEKTGPVLFSGAEKQRLKEHLMPSRDGKSEIMF